MAWSLMVMTSKRNQRCHISSQSKINRRELMCSIKLLKSQYNRMFKDSSLRPKFSIRIIITNIKIISNSIHSSIHSSINLQTTVNNGTCQQQHKRALKVSKHAYLWLAGHQRIIICKAKQQMVMTKPEVQCSRTITIRTTKAIILDLQSLRIRTKLPPTRPEIPLKSKAFLPGWI